MQSLQSASIKKEADPPLKFTEMGKEARKFRIISFRFYQLIILP